MTAREARNRRRAEERKARKLEKKRSQADQMAAPQDLLSGGETIASEKFNPALEDEFPREFQMQADAIRNRAHRRGGLTLLASPGFVSQSTQPEPNPSQRPKLEVKSTAPMRSILPDLAQAQVSWLRLVIL